MEWKTLFVTSTEQYVQLSIFQSFMYEVCWGMLNHFVIVYIDDSLFFSDSFEQHVSHVRQVQEK